MHTAPNSVLASRTFDAPRRFPWCDPPAGLTLTHDDVHVWRVALEVHEGVVHQLEDRLAADEQLRADRFQFAQDRRRFVVRRGGVPAGPRRGIGEKAPTAPVRCHTPRYAR